ncbi:hypothetical protein KR018_007666 [Drosophila ironensis]|nr:hypothetical protein KR018_007666 [Drosophila ironensis]
MLKRKLEQQKASLEMGAPCGQGTAFTSGLFSQPTWLRFSQIEEDLNKALEELEPASNIACIYNPLVYASRLHGDYLRRYLSGPKKLVLVGMNPGPNGMGQTGIPFGNVRTVKVMMQLSGTVDKPAVEHPKRPVVGLDCHIEEPSGVRLWELFLRLSGNMDTFSQQCFVHNFCPLAFFDEAGRNLTPSELKGTYKTRIRDLCLEALEQQLALLKPTIVVAVGEYVHSVLKRSDYCKSDSISVLRLAHPSPRSVNNTNWPEKAEAFLVEHDLVRFMRNEA